MPDRVLPPVVGVIQYKTDLVVRRKGDAPQSGGGKRKAVTAFTKDSRRRLAFVASNCAVVLRTMVTLTYPRQYPRDGRRVKRDLRVFIAALRRYTHGCEVLWFLEFQKRGAPHVHLLIDYPMPQDRLGKNAFRSWVALRWYQICGELDYKHLQAGTSTERIRKINGAAHYAVKYAAKMRQKIVPPDYANVGRFWGHTKGITPRPIATYRCTDDDLRGLLDGWKYEPRADRPVFHTLYNCSDRLTDYLAGTVDNTDDSEYTGRNGQSQRAPSKAEMQGRQLDGEAMD